MPLQAARHPHRGQAGAHRNLAGDERRPPRRAARLGVGVGRLSMDATSPSDHPGQGEIAALGARSSCGVVLAGSRVRRELLCETPDAPAKFGCAVSRTCGSRITGSA